MIFKKLVDYLKNAKLIKIDGADHRYTDPEDFNKIIETTINFLLEELK